MVSFRSYTQLSSFYWFYFVALGAWIPFWPLYLQSIGHGAVVIGLTSSFFNASRIIAPNIWGYLADRSNRRLSIIRWGCFLAMFSFLGIFIDQSVAFLCLIMFAFSFFWSAVLPQFEVLTLSKLRDKVRGYGKIRLWGSLGFVFSVLLLGLLFQYIDIDWFPWIISLCLLCLWLSTLQVKTEVKTPSKKSSAGFSPYLKNIKIWLFIVMIMLMQISFGPYYSFFSLYLQDLGYSSFMIGLIWAISIFSEVLLFIYIGRIIHYFNLRKVLLVSIVLAIVRWLVIAESADNLLLLMIVQCFHAFAFGAFHACTIEHIRRLFAIEHQGRGQAWMNSLGYGLGSMIGAAASGYLWDQYHNQLYVAAAITATMALLLAFYCVQELTPRQKKAAYVIDVE